MPVTHKESVAKLYHVTLYHDLNTELVLRNLLIVKSNKNATMQYINDSRMCPWF